MINGRPLSSESGDGVREGPCDRVVGMKQVISYDSSRGGVSVVTEKGAATTSYLLVQDATPADSGRYSCAPSNAELASVRVHVLNGNYTHISLQLTNTGHLMI